MLEQIEELAGGQLKSLLQQNGVPDEHVGTATEKAGENIADVLKNAVSGGQMDSILSLFTGGSGSIQGNPLVQPMISSFGSKMSGSAGGSINWMSIGVAVLPQVIAFISKKSQNSEGDNGLANLTSFLGGGSGGIGGMLQGTIGGLFK